MANNLIYVKRTTVSGRTPNTTGSYATNTQYISTGELALNLSDNKLFSSNGTAYFEIGSNTTNQNVSNTLTVKNISANGSNGTSGQVLTTNGTGTYWSTVTGGSGSSLTVRSTYGNGGTVNVTVGSVTAINFDESTGLHVTDQGSGNVFVSLGSGFKYITVAGQTTITAVGEDTLAIANGSLVTLATSNSAPKTLTIDLSANVVTNAQLSSNLSSYQTTAGLSANVATLSSNSATYLGGNTASDLRTYSSDLAANAYSNAVSYAASNSYVNTNFAPKASPTFTGTLNANDVVITGNLTVSGTTVVVNAATLDVKDLNITVAKGSTAAASDGAGITVDGSNAQLYYKYSANSWYINKSLVPDANVAYDLGTDTNRWRSLYISGSTIVIGAANLAATGTSIALPAGSTVNGVNLESFAVNTTVFSTFAQNTAIYSYAASNSYVNSTFQTNAGLSANVATLTSNNTSFVGSVSAANVVSNAQLSSNLSNYQTTAGLSSNIATLTSNNTSFVGSVSAANVVSNAQLSGNLSNYQTTAGMSSYQTTAGLSSNVATLTSNNTSFVGTVSAANVVSNAQLSANLANYVNTSGAYTFTGIHTYTANVSVNGAIIANGSVGTSGQVLTSSAGGNVYWSTVTGGGGGGASVTVSDTAPSTPSNGDLWFYTGTGELLIYYNDGNSSQWVTASAVPTPTLVPNATNANNALYLGGIAAADYQTEAGLAANVATLTSNNANYLNGVSGSNFASTGKAIAMAIVFGG